MSMTRRAALAVACVVLAAAPAAEMNELDSLRGRVVYLDFWASWCEPCRQSFPWMQRMQQSYETRGLTIIAVNPDHERADAESLLKQSGSMVIRGARREPSRPRLSRIKSQIGCNLLD